MINQRIKRRIKQDAQFLREYAADAYAIIRQIGHMAIRKRHFSAAWIMLLCLPKLVRMRRAKSKPEPISPFVYVMQ